MGTPTVGGRIRRRQGLCVSAQALAEERYNRHLSYVRNGRYYADQIRRAISMIDIVLDGGGRNEYADEEGIFYMPESFKHYVNMSSMKYN